MSSIVNDVKSIPHSDSGTSSVGIPGPEMGDLPLGLKRNSRFVNDGNFVARLKDLECENLDLVVNRLMKTKGWDRTFSETARREFLRLFSLRHITDNKVDPNRFADEFWHVFLLFTHEYRDFCQRHFGMFIDHVPSDRAIQVKSADKEQSDLYFVCFGEAPEFQDDVSNAIAKSNLSDRVARVGQQLPSLLGYDPSCDATDHPESPEANGAAGQASPQNKRGDVDNRSKSWGKHEKHCCW